MDPIRDVDSDPDLRQQLVMAAVERHQSGGVVLTSAGFAGVVGERFALANPPGLDWAGDCLKRLPYLAYLHADHWQYLPGPLGPADRSRVRDAVTRMAETPRP